MDPSEFKTYFFGLLLLRPLFVAFRQLQSIFQWLVEKIANHPRVLNQIAKFHHLTNHKILFLLPEIVDLRQDPIGFVDTSKSVDPQVSSSTLRESKKTLSELPIHQKDASILLCKDALVTNIYGVHDLNGNPYHNVVVSRGNLRKSTDYPKGYPVKIIPPLANEVAFLPDAYYINFLNFRHFGHLLTECISSIYPLLFWKSCKSMNLQMPIILHEQFYIYVDQLIDLLEIPKDNILIPGLTCGYLFVKNLYVSSPTIVNRRFTSSLHARAVKTYVSLLLGSDIQEPRNDERIKKIYVSRTKLGPSQRHLKEEMILEKLLERLGWIIVHPQELSLKAQLDVYQRVDYLCTQAGSAVHLLFGADVKGLKKIILLASYPMNNYTAQFESQGIDYQVITCLKEDVNCYKTGVFRNRVLKDDLSPEQLACAIQNSIPS